MTSSDDQPPDAVDRGDGADGTSALRPAPSLLLAGAAFLLGIVLATVLGAIAIVVGGDDGPAFLVGSFVGQWIVWVGACLLASRRFGSGSVRRDLDWSFDRRDVLLGVAVAFVGLAATLAVQQALSFLSGDLTGSNTTFVKDQAETATGAVVVALSTMIGAPVVEELFFRGLLQHALHRFRAAAVVLQALVFGIVHFTPQEGLGNVGIVAGLATFGIVLGVAVHRTRRLGVAIVGHGLFNAMAVLPIVLSR